MLWVCRNAKDVGALSMRLIPCTRYIAYNRRLDKTAESVKFHELQEILQAILSGYKTENSSSSDQKYLVTIEEWAEGKLIQILETAEKLSATDGGALVKIIANCKDPKRYQK
jgi:hypothetical protein